MFGDGARLGNGLSAGFPNGSGGNGGSAGPGGSNTAIFEARTDQGTEARYLIIDWGAALGAWGNNVLQRGRWDPDAFAAQNDAFIAGVSDDLVQWGYQGQRTVDMVEHITRDDVRWFDRVAQTISDEHLRSALRASGADANEIEQFTSALRARLEQIREVAATPAVITSP